MIANNTNEAVASVAFRFALRIGMLDVEVQEVAGEWGSAEAFQRFSG